jgi:hypothetical protein
LCSSTRRVCADRLGYESASTLCEPLGPINDTDGDNWIQVAGTKYWIEGIWSSQLYVIRQLKKNAIGIE